MQLTFLGTGTSGGIPSVGCHCNVCASEDPHDKRLRTSALVETEKTRLLIDCGPDFRQQIMPFPFKPFQGVLLTHIHFDHVAGIDDMRPFCVFGDLHLYTDKPTADGLRHNMPYCFAEHLYPGVPLLKLHEVEPFVPFTVGDVEILPFQVMHGKMPILAFKMGNLVYITDMKTMGEREEQLLYGIDTLVVNALHQAPEHHSHQLLKDAVQLAERVGARRTYLIHIAHRMGLHEEVNRSLPENIQLAYDGQVITID